MCLCALALPFTTCYARSCCHDCCCDCVNDECAMTDALAREDCAHLCCCLPQDQSVALCDPLAWYRFCCCARIPVDQSEVVLAAQTPVCVLPAAASMRA